MMASIPTLRCGPHARTFTGTDAEWDTLKQKVVWRLSGCFKVECPHCGAVNEHGSDDGHRTCDLIGEELYDCPGYTVKTHPKEQNILRFTAPNTRWPHAIEERLFTCWRCQAQMPWFHFSDAEGNDAESFEVVVDAFAHAHKSCCHNCKVACVINTN